MINQPNILRHPNDFMHNNGKKLQIGFNKPFFLGRLFSRIKKTNLLTTEIKNCMLNVR